jgi:tRNA dimethylallyltransferase
MHSKSDKKVLVICGPTSSGKTGLAVRLAKKFNGEVISADSRQVYRGMDIGTGKDLGEYGRVRYHLIDVASPRSQYTLSDWLENAKKNINEMHKRGTLPIVCGGTGLYISALVNGYQLPVTKKTKQQEKVIREKIGRKTLRQLLAILRRVDPETLKIIDVSNRRRVERALEIYYQTGLPKSAVVSVKKPPYSFLLIGLTHPRDVLRYRMSTRLKTRLKQGMVREVRALHAQGVSWKKLESFGLEYRFVSLYLQKKLTYREMVHQLDSAIYQYSRRQMTWFRRNQDVVWITSLSEAVSKTRKFVGN